MTISSKIKFFVKSHPCKSEKKSLNENLISVRSASYEEGNRKVKNRRRLILTSLTR